MWRSAVPTESYSDRMLAAMAAVDAATMPRYTHSSSERSTSRKRRTSRKKYRLKLTPKASIPIPVTMSIYALL